MKTLAPKERTKLVENLAGNIARKAYEDLQKTVSENNGEFADFYAIGVAVQFKISANLLMNLNNKPQHSSNCLALHLMALKQSVDAAVDALNRS